MHSAGHIGKIGFSKERVVLKMKKIKRAVQAVGASSVGAVLGLADGKGTEMCIQCFFFKGGREELYTLA